MTQGVHTGPIYRLLGPLEVCYGGKQAIIRPGRQEIVLCVLLLNANRVVSIDRLIDAVWDTEPPATARTQVQICVSALRANLGRIGLPASIVTKSPGYLMQVADVELDAQMFAAHVAAADDAVRAGDPAKAAGRLESALALWRGPALAGLHSPVLQRIAVQFDERRLSATETRFDLELRLGRHRHLVDELSELVNAYPLRERPRALLMLALYRSGRQADALDVYRTGRALLIDQLGLEPGDELRALEAMILAGGADLAPADEGPARAPETDVLNAEQALELLANVVGKGRIEAEPAAAQALFRLVGGLSLAMRIVAARLAARPHWSLAWMLERLSDERRRLDELTHGDLTVRASLAVTYDGLAPEARKLLRLLSLFDGASFPGWFAAALLDIDFYAAFDLLELLVDAQMLEIAGLDLGGGPRYRFHDLIRLFAREQLDSDESAEDRLAAVTRVTGGWLAIVDEAHRRIYGGDFTVLHGDAPRLPPPQSYMDGVLADDPFRWLDAEHANLCAAVELAAASGLAEASWDLACTLATAFEAQCLFDDWARTHERALTAVRAAGNRRGEAALLRSLGSLWRSRARPDEVADKYLLPALAMFAELGDRRGAALALRDLGLLDRGYLDGKRAYELFEQAEHRLGRVHAKLGQFDAAEAKVSFIEHDLADPLRRATTLLAGLESA